MKDNLESVLEGPRGRRLCLELAMELDPDVRDAVFRLGYDLDPGKGKSRVMFGAGFDDTGPPPPSPSPEQLAAALASLNPAALNDSLIQAALGRSVDTARYWQAPDGEDVLAGLPVIRAALLPLAAQVLDSPGTQWWAEPGRALQWAIDWRPSDDPAPLTKDPQQTLAAWGRNVRAEEARASRERPRAADANWSGSWWSIPHGLVHTVGQIPAGLSLVEDSQGWEHATVITVRGAGRTLEIRTAEDWISLCRALPLEVTGSRRHDWFRATGRDGRWVIPDWERGASEWDAVHLTVLGYLGSATRALQVDAGTASVIAGWDPDSTIWLTDVAREGEGPRQAWHRAPHDNTWIRTPTHPVGASWPIPDRNG
ncbi:hypothetical protein ACX8Z9_09075 [Arthrobacter halodurans]|uniref:Uncharacterized protein n=1 Tax=Arthrobacter halodurans TaxID=516699 RepID=A0ABV4UL43_9MICC